MITNEKQYKETLKQIEVLYTFISQTQDSIIELEDGVYNYEIKEKENGTL